MEEREGSSDDVIINEWDGLGAGLPEGSQDVSQADMPLRCQENDDLATSNTAPPNSVLIITNLIEDAFTSSDVQTEFEELFLKYDEAVQFQYLKSFRRVRVIFSSTENAKQAHANLNNCEICGQPFRCYFAQPIALSSDIVGRKRLAPPSPGKQYLLSPPASPPPGWEMIKERTPAINYDLIAAIDKMGPGESYELHSGGGTQPSIVVHICEDPEGYADRPAKIPQTRRPDRKP